MNIRYGIAAAVMHTNSMGSSSRLDMNQLKQLAITHRMEEVGRTATLARVGKTVGSIRAKDSTTKDPPHPLLVGADRPATKDILEKPGVDKGRADTKVGHPTKDIHSKDGPE